ncbi:MAG: 1,4-dihydroxy-2-naphthoyl-CoA hydrolase [Syntrophorhabdus sp. PtaB.Bin184]|nr:MAG: 1,4-dihydroxy-2-naphthoyl-CoA hydrolase [Syntrophorhabdus sp. PtaB.Bin184]
MLLLRGFQTEVEAEVRYGETDQMGVVYHANYFVWFNTAIDKLLSKLGIGIKDGEKQGYFMPIVEARCVYHYPARYGDRVRVRAVPEESSVARLVVHYEVINARSKRLLAEGRSVSVLVDKEGRLQIRIPDAFAGALGNLSRAPAAEKEGKVGGSAS